MSKSSGVQKIWGSVLILFITLISSPFLLANSGPEIKSSFDKEIRLIANHLPPYMIITETETGKRYSGFEHELSQKLSRLLGVKIKYFECTWAECMEALQAGTVDMAHTLLQTESRESFLAFIEPAYLQGTHTTIFYQRFDDERVIDDFKDLQQPNFVIGYIGSTVYFEEFEQADSLLKIDVKDIQTGIGLLASGKIDVLAGFDQLFDGIEFRQPNIKRIMKRSVYQPVAVLESHSVISKASPLYAKRAIIEKALLKLANKGELKSLSEKWVSEVQ